MGQDRILEIPGEVRTLNPSSNLDKHYGTFSSIEEAQTEVPKSIRKKGRTVGILQDDGGVSEWWWKYGIEDEDLIEKTLGGVSGAIFVTDVKPKTVGKNVSITYNPSPNEESIASVLTDEEDALLITIEWDRAENYRGMPLINSNEDNIEVINYTSKEGGTYIKADIEVPISELILIEFGDSEYELIVEIDTPPQVENITFGDYPINQTSLKENDPLEATIEVDRNIVEVKVQNFELAKPQIYVINPPTTNPTITLSVANRNILTATPQRIRITVISETGSESEVFTSIDTRNINNSVPSLNITGITYNGSSGQGALKDSEEAVINFSTEKTDVVSIQPLLTPNQLEVVNHNGINQSTVRRIDGGYNISSHNLRYNLLLNENGAINHISFNVKIAHNNPILSTTGYIQVRSGLGNINISSAFNQQVKVLEATIPINRGTLIFTPSTNFGTSYLCSISATNNDIHNNDLVNLALNVQNLAHREIILNRNYKIKGFINKTLTMEYPAYITPIGINVVDDSRVNISGIINTSPPFPICDEQVSTPEDLILASQWAFTDGGKTEIQISDAVDNFGYEPSVNIIIQIEEV